MTKELKALKSFNMDKKHVEFTCEKHGKMQVQIYKLWNDWSQPHCPICEEEKKKQQEAEELARKKAQEAKWKKQRIESLLQRSMIPKRFAQKSFDNFVAKTEDQKKKLDFCKKYAEKFEEMYQNGTSLTFCGTTGTGKTHLSCSIANHVITKNSKSAVFMSVMQAVRQVKETYSKDCERTEREALHWFLNPDLLILDEIGVQFGSEAEKLILFEILNERYQEMKPTILISNRTPKELVDFVGDRVIDRMKENGGAILQFKWDSHREKS